MKKYGMLFLSLVMLLVTLMLPGCAASDAPAFLNDLASKVGGWMQFSAILAGVLEMFIRLVPTANPQSLIKLFSDSLKGLGNLVGSVSKFLDSLGIQNVKQ